MRVLSRKSGTPHTEHLRDLLDAEQRKAIVAAIRFAFDTLAEHEGVEAEPVPLVGIGGFDSVLYGKRSGDTIIAYSFSGLVSDSFIPLFSAAVGFFTNSLGLSSAASAISGIRSLLKNASLLRRPGDDDAIEVIRAVIAVRTQGSNFSTDHDPRTDEIIQACGLGEDRTMKALKALRDRKILKVKHWGGQRDDVTDLFNSWTFSI